MSFLIKKWFFVSVFFVARSFACGLQVVYENL